MLSNSSFRIKHIGYVGDYLEKIEHIEKLATEFNEKKIDDEISKNLNKISRNLNDYKKTLNDLKEGLSQGVYKMRLPSIKEVDLWATKYRLEKEFFDNKHRNLQLKLSSALEELHKVNLPSFASNEVKEFYFPHNLIILGKPSVGKTHALAHAVKSRLNSDYPAIIIQAKNSLSTSWNKILQDALGLNTWTGDEIFTALETLAYRADIILYRKWFSDSF